ncbi:outer membrane transport energization protein ExbB [Moraxella cuniculi DSM 21768]|uniref:Biopolymer transport protein ExbB n=2 Tax=Moraxella cuniculi TaxID=34061 RepID=A0A1N7EIQ2_9GAMM|nr:MotA/TolQ/ExbB proton channel family protein [Moraxella cuniculi]OOS07253.1 biopolymer transporter ExbB [Moraxella cuniculi]SIR87907.1 outer membrane transport energization protein ExbB [Moraxella cuniculi DSM 21768]VEG13662.1 colicin uptake protein TolQ [Moraxella cuniculi]
MDFAFYWSQTDAVSKTLFFVLLLLSLASWVVGIVRVLNSRRIATTIADELHRRVDTQSLSDLAFEQRKMITEQNLLQQIARWRHELEKGLPILGTTASIAPFIGLFGTVWGIFHALNGIGKTGQAGLAQVAGPVGEALIMTGLGLAVAIPAVVFYNIAMRINKSALHTATDTAHQILAKVAR